MGIIRVVIRKQYCSSSNPSIMILGLCLFILLSDLSN
jgi:hypothetical protein